MLPTAPSKPQLCAVFMNSKVNNRLEPAGALKYVQMLYKLVMDYEKKKTKTERSITLNMLKCRDDFLDLEIMKLEIYLNGLKGFSVL